MSRLNFFEYPELHPRLSLRIVTSFLQSAAQLMAASSSRQPPQDIPLPPSPVIANKSQVSRKDKGKGKAKEQDEKPQARPTKNSADQPISAWPWVSLTDSAASNHPPVFTKDGRYACASQPLLCNAHATSSHSYFFSIVGSSIKICSAATGHVVSTLSAQHPHRKDPQLARYLTGPDVITSAILSPHNAFQLITASLNGCIMVWDFLDASLLQTVDLAQPVTHLCAHGSFKNSVFVGVALPPKKNKKGMCLVISVKFLLTFH